MKNAEQIAKEIENRFQIFYITLSGGKDSTSAALWSLKNLPRRKLLFVFSDTSHEARDTYKYINYLEKKLKIEIKRMFPPKTFYEAVEKKGYFPSKNSRFCTEILKKSVRDKVLTQLINKGYEKICIITGIRTEESEERAKYPIFEEKNGIGTFRPIISWKAHEVFSYIKENGVEINPLYEKGCTRVGCMPCIFASATEIKLLFEDPALETQRKKIQFLEKKIGRPFFINETLEDRYLRIKRGLYKERKKESQSICNISGISYCK